LELAKTVKKQLENWDGNPGYKLNQEDYDKIYNIIVDLPSRIDKKLNIQELETNLDKCLQLYGFDITTNIITKNDITLTYNKIEKEEEEEIIYTNSSLKIDATLKSSCNMYVLKKLKSFKWDGKNKDFNISGSQINEIFIELKSIPANKKLNDNFIKNSLETCLKYFGVAFPSGYTESIFVPYTLPQSNNPNEKTEKQIIFSRLDPIQKYFRTQEYDNSLHKNKDKDNYFKEYDQFKKDLIKDLFEYSNWDGVDKLVIGENQKVDPIDPAKTIDEPSLTRAYIRHHINKLADQEIYKLMGKDSKYIDLKQEWEGSNKLPKPKLKDLNYEIINSFKLFTLDKFLEDWGSKITINSLDQFKSDIESNTDIWGRPPGPPPGLPPGPPPPGPPPPPGSPPPPPPPPPPPQGILNVNKYNLSSYRKKKTIGIPTLELPTVSTGGSNNINYKKYIKYKAKYLNLKKLLNL
jgi:hypothetical protein